MGIEIERKFLVRNNDWTPAKRTHHYRQGYLTTGPPVAVRVRLQDNSAQINIKASTTNIIREEFEYPIPLEEAEEILQRLCSGFVIEKTRHFVEHDGFTWEIDVFEGVNAGLIVAEIELKQEDQSIPLPPWIGDEVSSDPKYLNASLATYPYSHWSEDAIE